MVRTIRHHLNMPRLHAGVARVLSEARRENWADCGRRWRKTSSIATHVVMQRLATHKNEQWLWGAPTYDQVQVARGEAELAANGEFKIYRADRIMECPWTHSLVRFRSLDNPDNARGHTAHGVVIDEAADINPEAFHKVLRPMMLDTKGIFWAIGTPKGHNWFWRQCENAKARLARDPNADVMFWQIPTLGARIVNGKLIREPNPYENDQIDFETLLEWFSDGTTPEHVFRQEYLAEFMSDGAGVFRGVDAAAFGVLLAPPFFGPFVKPYPGQFSMGVDWGRYNDFTVVTVMDVVTKRVVDWWRLNDRSWDSLVTGVELIWKRWHQNGKGEMSCLVEHNSIGSPNFEQLAKRIPCTPWTATNASKAAVIERLAFDIEHRLTTYPHIEPLMSELRAFQSERLPSGLTRYAAPEGEHDDCVISLALANEGTMYADLPTESGEFSMDLDADDDRAINTDLMGEYKASLIAKQAAERGIDHIPAGARPLLEQALAAQGDDDESLIGQYKAALALKQATDGSDIWAKLAAMGINARPIKE